MISELEQGKVETLFNLTSEQLDEVGNTELLPWAVLLGAVGAVKGELVQYTPTWHHGHAMMRFLPQRERATPAEVPPPAAEAPKAEQTFTRAIEGNTHAIEQVNDRRCSLRHSHDRRLVIKEVAARDGVFKVEIR